MKAAILALLILGLSCVHAADQRSAAKKAEPCCAVVAIDRKSGLVTLRDLKTGRASIVTVKDKAKLQSLRVGQQVDDRL